MQLSQSPPANVRFAVGLHAGMQATLAERLTTLRLNSLCKGYWSLWCWVGLPACFWVLRPSRRALGQNCFEFRTRFCVLLV